jgi:hypothetical protein
MCNHQISQRPLSPTKTEQRWAGLGKWPILFEGLPFWMYEGPFLFSFFYKKIYKRFMSYIVYIVLCSDLTSEDGLKALVQICKNRLRNCSARLSLPSHEFRVVIPVRARHLLLVR